MYCAMLLAILNVMYKKYFTAFSNVSCKTSIQDCLLHQKSFQRNIICRPMYSSKSPLQDVQNVNDLKKEGLFKNILFLFSRAATAVFT